MDEKNEAGLRNYSGAQGTRRPTPRSVLAALQEKGRLRAELEALTANIDQAVQSLSPNELHELQALMESEIAEADTDVEAFHEQIQQEAELAKVMRPMSVQIPRRAVAALAAEVERRIARGVYPSAEALVGEAVAKAFAGGRP